VSFASVGRRCGDPDYAGAGLRPPRRSRGSLAAKRVRTDARLEINCNPPAAFLFSASRQLFRGLARVFRVAGALAEGRVVNHVCSTGGVRLLESGWGVPYGVMRERNDPTHAESVER